MRRALRQLLVCVLAAGLIAGGPVCSHAQMDPCGSLTSHEAKDVPNYADWSVDPEDECSAQSALAGTTHHDDGLCKKCCATCVGASLLPTTPIAPTLVVSRQIVVSLDRGLVARSVPTEPGIPKPL